ncbi:hypothetical protein AMELA_G00208400 [Ameiurus melas]|uniref:BUD13 homolog n=1 Tax=Ameiurus melas TaxID=219545 RepID=A0A7J6A7Q7_AMEME|nr:hypothetical protein AMELA_G00208400 [Ameiurus melas]
MAASKSATSASTSVSKAEYLKRYLSTDEDGKKSKEKKAKKKRPKLAGRGMKIVDDDIDWRELAVNKEKVNKDEDDEEEAPVFKTQLDSNDSPDLSPPRESHTLVLYTFHLPDTEQIPNTDDDGMTPPHLLLHEKHTQRHHKDSPQREKSKSSSARRVPDLDLPPPRRRPNTRRDSDSDLSPPRKRVQGGKGSDSDLSPPRKRPQKKRGSDSDLSPPRRPRAPDAQTGPQMLSGRAAGLVSSETLKKEQEESRRVEKHIRLLEEESRYAQTIFRDKTGRKRDLDSERAEQSRKARERDEKYAQWGRGLVQIQMQKQNLVAALREAQKPLARHIDDGDLDKMLREQERFGDPMAALLHKKNKKKEKKKKKAKPKGIKGED